MTDPARQTQPRRPSGRLRIRALRGAVVVLALALLAVAQGHVHTQGDGYQNCQVCHVFQEHPALESTSPEVAQLPVLRVRLEGADGSLPGLRIAPGPVRTRGPPV